MFIDVINNNLKELGPLEVNDSKNVSLSIGGPIYATLRVDKRYYIPGEAIRYSAKVNNTSSRDVIRISFGIIQELVFVGSSYGGKFAKKESKTLSKLNLNKVIKSYTSEEIYPGEQLIIPNVSSSLNDSCKIIKVKYFLMFTFGVRGSRDKKLAVPITIGSMILNNKD